MKFYNKVNHRSQDNVLLHYVKERGVVFACILIDCFFMTIWIIGVWVTDKYVIAPLALKGVDKIALDIFQWASGIATLFTLLLFILKDLLIIVVRVRHEIKEVNNESQKKS